MDLFNLPSLAFGEKVATLASLSACESVLRLAKNRIEVVPHAVPRGTPQTSGDFLGDPES
jgi:hypothetical protein